MAINQGDVIWTPGPVQIQHTRLACFMDWLEHPQNKHFDDYPSLWQCLVDELDDFWSCVWEFFDIQADGEPTPVLASQSMPGTKWFPNAKLNYAEHVFRNASAEWPALPARSSAGNW